MTSTTIAEACGDAIERTWFHLAGLALILVNAIALGLETYDPLVASIGPVIRGIEYVCLAGFVVELLIRFGAHLRAPAGFFKDGWNVFDLFIVVAPLLPGVRENVTLLRLLRLARLVRTFRLFPSLRVILIGIQRALPGLGSFLSVMVLVLYGYAMLGWMMFGDAFPEQYGTVGQAMLTLFLLLSLDGITDTLVTGREVTEWAVLYYVSYMVAACYLLTNLLVGLVLTALQEAHEEMAAAKQPSAEETQRLADAAEKAASAAGRAALAAGQAAVAAANQAVAAKGDGPEPSVREQIAQVRQILDDVERRLPTVPAQPARTGR
ncbi:voltage-gated sodium channel [Catenuloplanes nepalensis]|uniref:Voltage-gated sodium channel n=1 Tax=Catenuloplanes nepalensis TaxID=587533 RepID=A0ABT9MLR4_9ACTN|nr:ion transporter [Catenuloplanes nepalensis]MDP9792355.1 voltage-gated sodium channel [Catenuloplanes nepalensis]